MEQNQSKTAFSISGYFPSLPEAFDIKNPDDWSRWKRRFQQLRVALGLDEQSEAKQVSTLLYSLGEEAEDILRSTNIKPSGKRSYTKVLEKLDEYIQVRHNVIFERARFNRRNQLEGESCDQYITELYSLAERCSYGHLMAEMIRDRLVVGILDKGLSEKRQLYPELTLEQAKTMVRQKEAVHEHQQVLKGVNDGAVEGLRSKSARSKSAEEKHRFQNPVVKSQYAEEKYRASKPVSSKQSKNCMRCGKGQYSWHSCPARDVTCHRCQRKGHYSSQCRSRTVAEVESSTEEESCMDTAYIDALSQAAEPWKVN